MSKHHIVEFDGYHVGERLLEGVMFNIEVIEDDNNFTVGNVAPSKESERYVSNINWKSYTQAMINVVQDNIKNLQTWCAQNNTTMRAEFERFAQDSGEPEAQMLMEI